MQLVFTHADSSLRPHPASRAHMVFSLKYVITARTKRHLITLCILLHESSVSASPTFLSLTVDVLLSYMYNRGLHDTRSIIMREFLYEIESVHNFVFAEPMDSLNLHPIFFLNSCNIVPTCPSCLQASCKYFKCGVHSLYY